MVLLLSSLLVDTLCDQILDCYSFNDSTLSKFAYFSSDRRSVKKYNHIHIRFISHHRQNSHVLVLSYLCFNQTHFKIVLSSSLVHQNETEIRCQHLIQDFQKKEAFSVVLMVRKKNTLVCWCHLELIK